MQTSHRDLPPLGLGLASVVLGAIGLMLFVLPVLAIPISACGLVSGVVGVVAALAYKLSGATRVGRESIAAGGDPYGEMLSQSTPDPVVADGRLAIAGTVVCALAVSVELAIASAPSGDWGQPRDPMTPSPELPKPHIAPPARFRG